MCRFLMYKGRQMFMSDLITNARQSLIRQSYGAKERPEPLNGDGFGVGWYVQEIDPEPCVFTSTSPAWSNRNLHRLAAKVRSSCFFAHVRAATPGLWVSEANCHPFQFRQFLWMHNGKIADFSKVKRDLRRQLDDEIYNFIQGTTDSEHVFALYLNELRELMEVYSSDLLRDVMVSTIAKLNHLTGEAGITANCTYNFALTDGNSAIVTRYATSPTSEPPTLYLARGERFDNVDGDYRMIPAEENAHAVIVASEPLTEDRSQWMAVPRNHLVQITPELHVRMEPLP